MKYAPLVSRLLRASVQPTNARGVIRLNYLTYEHDDALLYSCCLFFLFRIVLLPKGNIFSVWMFDYHTFIVVFAAYTMRFQSLMYLWSQTGLEIAVTCMPRSHILIRLYQPQEHVDPQSRYGYCDGAWPQRMSDGAYITTRISFELSPKLIIQALFRVLPGSWDLQALKNPRATSLLPRRPLAGSKRSSESW